MGNNPPVPAKPIAKPAPHVKPPVPKQTIGKVPAKPIIKPVPPAPTRAPTAKQSVNVKPDPKRTTTPAPPRVAPTPAVTKTPIARKPQAKPKALAKKEDPVLIEQNLEEYNVHKTEFMCTFNPDKVDGDYEAISPEELLTSVKEWYNQCIPAQLNYLDPRYNFETSVINIKAEYNLEEGPKFRRLHAHARIIILHKPECKIHIDLVAMRAWFYERLGRNIYIHVKYVPPDHSFASQKYLYK